MAVDNQKRPSVPGIEGAKKLPEYKLDSIATWNVRTLNQDFHTELVIKEMKRLKIKILGVSETHWTCSTPETFEQDNCVILQSPRKDNIKRQGVAFIIDQSLARNIVDYNCISERLISVTLSTIEGPLTIFQVYAPDTSYSESDIEEFYDCLQHHVNSLPSKNKFIVMGDFNAKIGEEQYEN